MTIMIYDTNNLKNMIWYPLYIIFNVPSFEKISHVKILLIILAN